MTTPLMGLTLPVVSVTIGPEWASEVNTALGVIDGHTHTAGSGASISLSSILVSADFSMASYNITTARSYRMDNQGSTLALTTDKNQIYVVSGNLYYNNSSGTAIQLTSGSGINIAGTGTIGGDYGGVGVSATVTYNNTTKVYSFLQAANTTAKMAIGDILLYENVASTNPITIKSPASLASSYTLTLPSAGPNADTVLAFSGAGIGTFRTILGTASQITLTATSSSFTVSLPNAVTMPGTLAVTGAASLSSTLAVTGAITASAAVSVGTTLSVTGASSFAAPLLAANGSSGAPSYSFTNTSASGWYYDSPASSINLSVPSFQNKFSVNASVAYLAVPLDGQGFVGTSGGLEYFGLTRVSNDTRLATYGAFGLRVGATTGYTSGLNAFTVNTSGVINYPQLTATTVLALDGSKNMFSAAYSSAGTPSTFMTRDSSGNTTVNALIALAVTVSTSGDMNIQNTGTGGVNVRTTGGGPVYIQSRLQDGSAFSPNVTFNSGGASVTDAKGTYYRNGDQVFFAVRIAFSVGYGGLFQMDLPVARANFTASIAAFGTASSLAGATYAAGGLVGVNGAQKIQVFTSNSGTVVFASGCYNLVDF